MINRDDMLDVNRSGDENRIDIFHADPEFTEDDLINAILGE